MTEVKLNDSGWYSCRVVNEHLNINTKCGFLHVVAEDLKGSLYLFGIPINQECGIFLTLQYLFLLQSERSRPGTSNRQITMRLEAVILVALGISSVFLVTVIIIAFMCRKYRRERRKKKMAGDAFRQLQITKITIVNVLHFRGISCRLLVIVF